MPLKITKEIEKANLITHSSSFHPDDVFSTMFLSKIVENPVVCRTIDTTGANKDAKLANYEHMLSVNPWIVLNDHLNINDLKKYFNFVLN